MITILLIEANPGYLEKIKQYLSDMYSITNAEFTARFLNSLPRNEDGYSTDSIEGTVITDYYPLKDQGILIDDATDYKLVGDVIASFYIKPVVTWTDELDIAKQWLKGIENTYPMVAADFETRDLTLPQFNEMTMITLGWNLTKSIVIVFKDLEIRDYVLNWLVTTPTRQVYHNSLFDVRFIHWHTGKLPKHVEDTQLLAAVYRNHVNPDKRKSGLKELAKYPYADWASDKSSFDLYDTSNNSDVKDLFYVGSNTNIEQYNLSLIKYCGIDSIA